MGTHLGKMQQNREREKNMSFTPSVEHRKQEISTYLDLPKFWKERHRFKCLFRMVCFHLDFCWTLTFGWRRQDGVRRGRIANKEYPRTEWDDLAQLNTFLTGQRKCHWWRRRVEVKNYAGLKKNRDRETNKSRKRESHENKLTISNILLMFLDIPDRVCLLYGFICAHLKLVKSPIR